jgi:hypothetical protein
MVKARKMVESGGIQLVKLETMANTCRAYLANKPNAIAEGVFRRHVYDDPIATVKLDKLRRRHLKEWRKRLEETPALVSRNKKGKKRTKQRTESSINRDMVPMRAASGQVLVPGVPNTDAAWQEALKPHKGADKRRDVYLDRAERKALLDANRLGSSAIRACALPLAASSRRGSKSSCW